MSVQTLCGESPKTLIMQNIFLVDLVEGKEHFWQWVVLSLDGDLILGGASGSQPISMGCMASNRAQAESACREQLVSNLLEYQPKLDHLFSSHADPSPGFKNIPTVLGPMGRSVEDIELACQVVFGKSADYSSVPVLYHGLKLAKRLKFGYYFNDGMAQITPACHRAVSETVKALRKQGHECIEFELPSRVFLTCYMFCIPYPML